MNKFLHRLCNLRDDCEGAVAAEVALSLPVLFVVGCVATDFSFWILARHQAVTAAHAGALYGASFGTGATAITNAQSACQSMNTDKSYFTLTCSAVQSCRATITDASGGSCGATGISASGDNVTVGSYITVTATVTYAPFTPLLGSVLGANGYQAVASLRVF